MVSDCRIPGHEIMSEEENKKNEKFDPTVIIFFGVHKKIANVLDDLSCSATTNLIDRGAINHDKACPHLHLLFGTMDKDASRTNLWNTLLWKMVC